MFGTRLCEQKRSAKVDHFLKHFAKIRTDCFEASAEIYNLKTHSQLWGMGPREEILESNFDTLPSASTDQRFRRRLGLICGPTRGLSTRGSVRKERWEDEGQWEVDESVGTRFLIL